jgi:hypothetical protein
MFGGTCSDEEEEEVNPHHKVLPRKSQLLSSCWRKSQPQEEDFHKVPIPLLQEHTNGVNEDIAHL